MAEVSRINAFNLLSLFYNMRKTILLIATILLLFSAGYTLGLFLDNILYISLGNQLTTLFSVTHASNKTADLLTIIEFKPIEYIPLFFGLYTSIVGTLLLLLVKEFLK